MSSHLQVPRGPEGLSSTPPSQILGSWSQKGCFKPAAIKMPSCGNHNDPDDQHPSAEYLQPTEDCNPSSLRVDSYKSIKDYEHQQPNQKPLTHKITGAVHTPNLVHKKRNKISSETRENNGQKNANRKITEAQYPEDA